MTTTMKHSMLTTIDNPHNPFDDFDSWYNYDYHHGYHTPSFLARIAFNSESLSEADQSLAIEEAIDEIIKENVLGLYTKVTQDVIQKE